MKGNIKRFYFLIATIFILLLFSYFLQIKKANAASDTQLWLEGGIKYPINKNLRLSFDQSLRFENNVKRVEKIFPEFSIRYKPLRFLSVHAGYRFTANIKYDANVNYTDLWHRFFFGFQLNHKFKSITLKYRFRFQEVFGWPKLETGVKFKHSFRNKIGAEWDATKKIKPSLDFEIWMRAADNDGTLHKYRLTPGIEYRLKREHRLEVYYSYEGMLNGSNDRFHIVGLGYYYVF